MRFRLDIVPSILVAALLLPAQAGAAGARVQARLIGPGHAVRAGTFVELRWEALPADVEELEILLSLDGGRQFNLRVSPECDPGTGRYRWRVPNLASSNARLMLRYRLEGREREAEPTAPFVILARTDAPAEFDQFSEHGWWSGLERAPAETPADLAPRAPSLAISRLVHASPSPPREDAARGAAAQPRDRVVAPAAPLPAPRPATASSPRVIPLRV